MISRESFALAEAQWLVSSFRIDAFTNKETGVQVALDREDCSVQAIALTLTSRSSNFPWVLHYPLIEHVDEKDDAFVDAAKFAVLLSESKEKCDFVLSLTCKSFSNLSFSKTGIDFSEAESLVLHKEGFNLADKWNFHPNLAKTLYRHVSFAELLCSEEDK